MAPSVINFSVADLQTLAQTDTKPIVGNSLYCASILPCDEKGELLPEFNNPIDGCHTYFLNQCEKAKVQLKKESECAEAIKVTKTLRRELTQLKKRFSHLRRKSRQDLR